jgi:Cu+-exporting ATPase
VTAEVGGRRWRIGNAAFAAQDGASPPGELLNQVDALGATGVWIAGDNRIAGVILLRDRLREGVEACIRGLQELEIGGLVMLTGDRRSAAEAIARAAGIADVEAGLLPEQKHSRIRQLISQGRAVGMVGDGINDAPALAAANVGIAVAGANAIATEAADVVYLPQSLAGLPEFFSISRRAVATAWQNIFLFAGAVNLAAVLLAASGKLGPVGAAVTHQLSSFLVMMNSLRLLRVEGGGRGILARLFAATHLREVSDLVRDAANRIDPEAAFRWLAGHRPQLFGPAIAFVALAIALNGVYLIPPDEVGIVLRFGRQVMPHDGPGIHYKLPWPVDQLTRVQDRRVRVVEIGFRTTAAQPDAEPAAYEWNVQHRSGRFQRQPDESLMLTGDQNMIELNASIHYDLARPDEFVFGQFDGAATVRVAAESTIQSVVTGAPLDDVLTTGRSSIEQRVKSALQSRVDRYHSGIRVLSVRLEDVHPSLEVVDAFRDVSGAFEEKNRVVNEAEAYRNEQVALARGNAKASLAAANGYTVERIHRAEGDAGRFTQREEAFRSAPGPTQTRLYLETIEQVLPGKKKLIVDSTKGRRQLFLVDDGVEIGGAALSPVFPGTSPVKPAKEP